MLIMPEVDIVIGQFVASERAESGVMSYEADWPRVPDKAGLNCTANEDGRSDVKQTRQMPGRIVRMRCATKLRIAANNWFQCFLVSWEQAIVS
jgi:hypothetical protein